MERKLRPIYDAIDCGNLKLALKGITAVLQARPCLLLALLASRHSAPTQYVTMRPFAFHRNTRSHTSRAPCARWCCSGRAK